MLSFLILFLLFVKLLLYNIIIIRILPHSDPPAYDEFVKLTSRPASLPLVLMHVVLIAFLSLSMVMSLPTLR